MEDWKIKMIDEFKELVDRIEKLEIFAHENLKFRKLNKIERDLFLEQLNSMTTHLDALKDMLEYRLK